MNHEGSTPLAQLQDDNLKGLYKRHLIEALVRSVASTGMWVFALIAFFLGTFKTYQFIGISVSVIYLIMMSFLILIIIRYMIERGPYEYFSLFINQLEIIGYTAIIYFCGGIEASYLTLIYASLIAYVGTVASQRHTFNVASLCVATFSLMFGSVHFGIIPQINPNFTITWQYQLLIFLAVIFLLYMVAYISASSANLLRRHRDTLYQQNTVLEGTNEQLKHEMKERKRVEEEKRKLEVELRQAEKMEAIGTLAGGIAHDFNNILAAIFGYCQLALMKIPEGHQARNNLEEVLTAGKRAKDLVQQILTFSRQTEPVLVPIDISPVLEEALKFLRSSIPTTIEIRQNIQADSGLVLSDPTQIHQVIINLCTNAAHAMLESEKSVLEVSLTNVELDSADVANDPDLAPGGYLKLSISDTAMV